MTVTYEGMGELEEILKQEKPKSILLITGNKSYDNNPLRSSFEEIVHPYTTKRINGFSHHPSLKDIDLILKDSRVKKPDLIIGFGGGTVMDIAKAVAILTNNQGDSGKYVRGEVKPTQEAIRTVLIPTTAGTGAEVTPFSVVYIENTKYSLSHELMKPTYAILDWKGTETLPPRETATSGFDALAQGIEAHWSVNATVESRTYSREAIRLANAFLEEAIHQPSQESRENMLLASHLAGKAISIAKTTAAHALSYPLTAYHGLEHGYAVMLTLPYFVLINGSACEDNLQEGLLLVDVKNSLEEIRELFGVESLQGVFDRLQYLLRSSGLETRLSRLGIEKSDLPVIVKNGFNPARVKNNPVIITEDHVRNILEQIL